MSLGVFELAGLAAALAWTWWSFVGMTSQDRKTIEAHYARRQEQLVGL